MANTETLSELADSDSGSETVNKTIELFEVDTSRQAPSDQSTAIASVYVPSVPVNVGSIIYVPDLGTLRLVCKVPTGETEKDLHFKQNDRKEGLDDTKHTVLQPNIQYVLRIFDKETAIYLATTTGNQQCLSSEIFWPIPVCIYKRVFLAGWNLQDAELQGAHLPDVYLRWANLKKADLSNANLKQVSTIHLVATKAVCLLARMPLHLAHNTTYESCHRAPCLGNNACSMGLSFGILGAVRTLAL
ncbi:hypothetical protein CYMTET_39263 [Cymbomonas tetramitiformis]|uniref:Uncharacterized protein n=1 Tax=Cymbomonas tetramitiformis TaxID=36881 RepID=A0AAE0CCN2_9CHLO|nr:hypothetical protein CYMTET_39263 [Cymbomonas tetramitiformis]